MNKKILDLIRVGGVYEDNSLANIEKFVKLILVTCVDIVSNSDGSMCGEEILQHFDLLEH